MNNVVKGLWRNENGEDIFYSVENESHEDEYGTYKQDYVPYRTSGEKRKRLSPPTMALSYMEAEKYITFGEWQTCQHCGSSYFKRESDGIPSVTSGQPA